MSTDACPECEPDHIDIQALTFNKARLLGLLIINVVLRLHLLTLYFNSLEVAVVDIEDHTAQMAPMVVGRVDMKYRRVECTPPSGVTISVVRCLFQSLFGPLAYIFEQCVIVA